MHKPRSSLRIVLDVWKALFLREAIYRLFLSRGAWAWLVVEPVVHFGFLMALRTFMSHDATSGINSGVYILSGILAFFMGRNTATHAMEAVNANKALFTYRQVKPVDTVLVRVILEGMLLFINSVLIFTGAGLFDLPVIPDDFLAVFMALLGLWLLGTGLGLIFSVVEELSVEIGKIIKLSMFPLYFISGVMIPVKGLPPYLKEPLTYNPFLHGVELVRGGYFHNYRLEEYVSSFYLYGFALVSIFLGLAMHVRYAKRLAAP